MFGKVLKIVYSVPLSRGGPLKHSKLIWIISFLVLLTSNSSFAENSVAELKYSAQCIFIAIMNHKKIVLKEEVPFPSVYVASKTPLKQFQDAVEPQWGMRPGAFLNAYIVEKNEIYLLDDANYYEKTGRFLDDSLAHELTHYIQVKYQNASLNEDETLETDAVFEQTWFRETYMKNQDAPSPCPDLM